jgi:hypothetical protein
LVVSLHGFCRRYGRQVWEPLWIMTSATPFRLNFAIGRNSAGYSDSEVYPVKDLLIVVVFLAMVLTPPFAALNVFSQRKNRF